ncbi:MAG TPA: hypothetical protein VNN73_12975 [Blastocatellia bacterium]|nr:hypothetical protein [Blastocatellia bacterium]
MEFEPLTIACPGCGSPDVVYSCHPDCCFNHVCSNCLSNFELATKDSGETLPTFGLRAEEKDSCAPTVQCARCSSLDVYQLKDEKSSVQKLACAKCRALLALEFSPA